MADLDAGATGAMTGGGYPDGIRQIIDPYFAGRPRGGRRSLPALAAADQLREPAVRAARRQGADEGRRRDRAPRPSRHPLQPLHPDTRAGLIEIARRLDPLVLRWGK